MSQDTFDATTDAFIGALPAFEVSMNTLAAAMALNATTDTSSSSVAIGTGSKTFTVTAGKSFVPGMWLVIADTAAPTTNAMYAQVSSYSGTTLIVDSAVVTGSGTKTAWQISQTVPATASVLLAGNQTVAGVKTFSSPVGVAAATASGDAVRKDQLPSVFAKPFASVSRATNQVLGAAGVVIFDTEASDTTSSYNTGTGLYTAPNTGTYFINIIMTGTGTGQLIQLMYIRLNGATRTRDMFEGTLLAGNEEMHSSWVISLTAGDTLDFYSDAAVTVEGSASGIIYFAAMQIVQL
jgi:hypothetical protein